MDPLHLHERAPSPPVAILTIEPADSAPGAPENFSERLRQFAARQPGADIAITMAGVELPFAWDARLRKAAYAASGIAAAVPMCDASSLHALVDAELRSDPRADSAIIDRAAYCMGQRAYYEIPRLHPACVYLRRDALDLALSSLPDAPASAQEVLDALMLRWRALGWSGVICDYLYVGLREALPVSPEAAGAIEDGAFAAHHPLGALRREVNDAIRRGIEPMSMPGLDHRPVQLHIMHFWGGGLDRWVRDFGRADADRINMILATYRIGERGGQRLVLYSDPAAMIPIRTWDIARPIPSVATASVEYRRILEQVIAEFEVEAIIVSSLIGHALDALTQPLRTLVVCHDLFPVCQAINPQFGKTCERCTLDDLRLCAKSNPLNRIFVDQASDEWHAMRTRYTDHLLAGRIEMVVPSPWVAATLKRLDPRLQGVTMHVVPHGIDMDVAKVPVPRREAGRRLRLVVLGRMSLHKGMELLRAACEDLRPYADITLLGCGKNGVELAGQCGWRAIEKYQLVDLPELMRSLEPDAALLASVVPETFSYTLSELNALGVPAIASALGSFRERIVDGETGFLFEPTKEGFAGVVRKLHGQPELLDPVARGLRSRAASRTTREMVADYHALVPLAARPVARFRVGIGTQTALTEPYRHLDEAYAQLTGAYAELDQAYDDTRGAYEHLRSLYDHTHHELDALKASWSRHSREFSALEVRRHWWRLPRAMRILLDWRGTMDSLMRSKSPKAPATQESSRNRFPWSERLSPQLLKSPWWIGHIPFAFELVGRLRPKIIVELGTYSGSSFAAFCQAVEACELDTKCFGIDLWEGDIHMGKFDEELFRETSTYLASHYPGVAELVRKDFNEAVHLFADKSIDLLHIDGTHTFEAVSNDFNTWLPKVSDRGVVLFHDVNVNVENTGPASVHFGVRRVFDGLKGRYPHLEFDHCWGLGVLVVGKDAPRAVTEMIEMSRSPGFASYFAEKGAEVSKRFAEMGVELPVHEPYSASATRMQRAAGRLQGLMRRALRNGKVI
jgi:glycosyltransferase involved in cell wall biosynthesis/predicted O-methyltransferase YrrM